MSIPNDSNKIRRLGGSLYSVTVPSEKVTESRGNVGWAVVWFLSICEY